MPVRLTRQGYERLRKELEQLYQRRAQLIDEVRETAAEGDLSENAGLDAAKRTLGIVDAQIRYLEQRLADAEIIEQDGQPERVDVGVIATFQDLDTNEIVRYRIAESMEMDFSAPVKTATPQSPIGKTLLGKSVGDEVTLQLRGRTQRLRLIALSWDGGDAENDETLPQP
jgi:transcription elongation factor GreA